MELITLQHYDIRWNETFKIEKEVISNILGKDIINIHHIGSTAVPGLLAKPIIDIAIESYHFPPSQAIIEKLAYIGYESKGESGIMGRFWFKKGHPRKFNLHYCSVNSEIVQKQVVFRNNLIKNEHLRRDYELLKLKHHKGRDVDSSDYADAKSEFVHKVIRSNEQ